MTEKAYKFITKYSYILITEMLFLVTWQNIGPTKLTEIQRTRIETKNLHTQNITEKIEI